MLIFGVSRSPKKSFIILKPYIVTLNSILGAYFTFKSNTFKVSTIAVLGVLMDK